MSKHKQKNKKEKIGAILDERIVRKIKEHSYKEGRTISEIIEDAILKYEEIEPIKYQLRKAVVGRFCSKPFNLSQNDFKDLLT